MRLFLAIEPPTAVLDTLTESSRALERVHDLWGLALTRRDQWHITLRFLGETSSEQLSALEAAWREPLAGCRSFEMELGGWGTFPLKGKPHMIWIGVRHGAAELQSLATVIEAASEKAGAVREDRPFHPHLTMARVKHPVRRTSLDEFFRSAPDGNSPAFRVEGVYLVRSHLGASGARYENINYFSLRPNDKEETPG